MRRRKEPLILRVPQHNLIALLYLAVFGKEDLMHTLPVRDVKMRSVVLPTRSKA